MLITQMEIEGKYKRAEKEPALHFFGAAYRVEFCLLPSPAPSRRTHKIDMEVTQFWQILLIKGSRKLVTVLILDS